MLFRLARLVIVIWMSNIIFSHYNFANPMYSKCKIYESRLAMSKLFVIFLFRMIRKFDIEKWDVQNLYATLLRFPGHF